VITLLLEVLAAGGRYLVPRDHVDWLELLRAADAPPADERGRPLVVRELAPLLGWPATPPPGRRQALGVALRRRSVALLVDRVEGLACEAAVAPLPPLLGRRLAAPWVTGAVAGDPPALVLDLRRIAADVALGLTDRR
jgi:chemotaxis signal transduction protein